MISLEGWGHLDRQGHQGYYQVTGRTYMKSQPREGEGCV